MTTLDAQAWQNFLSDHPEAHILQSAAWGELKSAFGWEPVWLQDGGCGAQILFRKLPLGFTVAYIPKGPVGEDWQSLWPEVDAVCRKNRAIFLKIEPDGWENQSNEWAERFANFLPSEPVQPRRTVEVSLEGGEEDWLARMKQKTRYNIRLAEKKEVVIRLSNDITAFYQLMQTTGERDNFGVHSLAYYQKAFDLFAENDSCALLHAEFSGQLLAGLMVFAQGSRAWYFYGASSNLERNRMPAYLLQFEAMRWAAARGCMIYDMWGIPDVDEEQLEQQFSGRGDGLWGVYRFKRGFGGEVRRSVGAWDKIYQPALYRLYQLYSRRRGGE